jgi:phage terminase large subunit-like protein
MWDLSLTDWQERIRKGQSLIPELPLITEEADFALEFYNSLHLPDVGGKPLLRDASGDWAKDMVRALFGSYDPEKNVRHIEEIFALIAKKNSKTTYGAAIMLTALLMNKRPRAEFLFVGPTQAISDLAFSQADGMIEADEELTKRFHVRDHIKTIKDRLNGAKLKIKTFHLNILTGPKPAGVMLDELHLLGKDPNASKVIRQLRGGRQANPEGFLIITTTQSDEVPAGAFKEELQTARAVRDGRMKAKILPLLYEFPDDIAKDEARWGDSANWPMVMPNLGRSLRLDSLILDWETEKTKGAVAKKVWASQHLNVQIGLGLRTDGWPGAEFWAQCGDPALTLEEVLARSEVAVVGLDGGGLDDLFGMAVLGREKETRRWLLWSHAWAQRIVLERRKEIAPRILDFEREGTLTLVENGSGDDITEICDIIEDIKGRSLLPKEDAIGVDPSGISEVIDELERRGFKTADENGKGAVTGVRQGALTINSTSKTSERRLAAKNILHGGSDLMAWCVGNAKVVQRGNAVSIEKQASGTAKIDPLMALFNAVSLMDMNPSAPKRSVYETRGIRIAA